jgi:capsular exopolysaccharide synthesis family protein
MVEPLVVRQLPAPASWPAPSAVESWRISSPLAEPAAPASISLSEYLWIIKRHRWKILTFVLASVAATLIVSSRITPVYESTATIDIDRRMPAGVLGEEAMQSGTSDTDQFLATQVRLVQSDSVLRPVADRFKLLENGDASIPDDVKAGDAAEAPVQLKKLKVTRPANTYLMLISYRSPDARLASGVANAIAQSYIDHTYNIRYRSSASLSAFMEKQLEELKAKMEQSGAALAQFERELNVINPEEKTSILSSRLLQLNTEYTSAQADRVRKEAAENSVRGGSLEAAQVSAQGEALKRMSERVDEAQSRFADVGEHYGPNHPEYRKAAAQLAESRRQLDSARQNIAQRVEVEYRQAVARERMLEGAVSQTKAEFDRLNTRSFEYQSLKREAEADKKLYEELVRKIKEAGINAGFQNSAIRVADPARPAVKPVFPIIPLNALLAFVLSSLLAIGVAVLTDALDTTIRDPEQVARTLKAEVIGSLPTVKSWRGRLALIAGGENGKVNGHRELILASESTTEHSRHGYEDAIRSLRNSILLADFERNLHSLLVTSASPAEGKSTVAANLALAHARQGRKTLLIDADLRRPSLHKRFQIPVGGGLASVLLEGADWRTAVSPAEGIPDLAILAAGAPSRRATELIGKGLVHLLDEAVQTYDLVIVDAPPTLGFAEPLEIATIVDGVIVVARAGETERKAVSSVLASLQRLRANIVGVVLNQIQKNMADTYHYYGYYGKYYHDRDAETQD